MRYYLLVFALFFSTAITAQGIDFFEGSWNEALAEAKKQGKVIFVDAYAVWCGPCKRMSKMVFTDNEVGEFYNKNFVNVKLDMERGEGLEFRKKYPVTAFPTLFYIDYDGKVVQQIRGALQAKDFIQVGQGALGKADRSGAYAEAYEKGDRSPELVYNYIKALNQAGKPSLKITNEYLRNQENLSLEDKYKIIYEGTTEADSRIFDQLIEYRSPIEAIFSKLAVEEKVIGACKATVDKAIDYRSEMLLEEAIEKADNNAPELADAFVASSKMEYYKVVKDAESYLKAAKDFSKTFDKQDKGSFHELSVQITKTLKSTPKAMEFAEDLAKTAADKSDNFAHHLNYASILLNNGKKGKAYDAAKKAETLAIAGESGRSVSKRLVDEFLKNFED
ncbi:MAG: thioredoxin family protein [Bacteroidota bacterium]